MTRLLASRVRGSSAHLWCGRALLLQRWAAPDWVLPAGAGEIWRGDVDQAAADDPAAPDPAGIGDVAPELGVATAQRMAGIAPAAEAGIGVALGAFIDRDFGAVGDAADDGVAGMGAGVDGDVATRDTGGDGQRQSGRGGEQQG